MAQMISHTQRLHCHHYLPNSYPPVQQTLPKTCRVAVEAPWLCHAAGLLQGPACAVCSAAGRLQTLGSRLARGSGRGGDLGSALAPAHNKEHALSCGDISHLHCMTYGQKGSGTAAACIMLPVCCHSYWVSRIWDLWAEVFIKLHLGSRFLVPKQHQRLKV
jgi:hypothetical protein